MSGHRGGTNHRPRPPSSEDPRNPRGHSGHRVHRVGLLVFVLALGLAVAGSGIFLTARSRSPVEGATLGDLELELQRIEWLEHQMSHSSGGFERPASMMPGMPEEGFERLSVEVAVTNRGRRPAELRSEELVLELESGTLLPAGALVPRQSLLPDQSLVTTVFFDVETDFDMGRVRLVWRHAGDRAYMAVPHPPLHHAQPRGDVDWPLDVSVLLPIGRPDRGRSVFQSYGCKACHGDPAVPGSHRIGPHLGRIGADAAHRTPRTSATQYLYQSILEPNRFIAPECADREPCAEPSAMPEYGALLSWQEMADLVMYLAAQAG